MVDFIAMETVLVLCPLYPMKLAFDLVLQAATTYSASAPTSFASCFAYSIASVASAWD